MQSLAIELKQDEKPFAVVSAASATSTTAILKARRRRWDCTAARNLPS